MLTKLILLPMQKLIFGHSHRDMPDFEINGTKMITNQLGYVEWHENYSFQRDKILEI